MKGWGEHLTQPPPRGLPPGNGPTAFLMLRMLSGNLGCFCLGGFCSHVCLLVCTVSVSIQTIGTGEELGLHLSGVFASCLAGFLLLRHRGRFPWWGGFRTPRYHGPLGCRLRKCRAAHGPRHPAVIIPLRLCMLGFVLFV